MKKLITILLTLTLLVFPLSCKKPKPYLSKISQLRENVYLGSKEDFRLTLYPESRENPLENDGVVGKTEKVLIFKLDFSSSDFEYENCKITFNLGGKSYNGVFEYKPLSTFLYASVTVESLPQNELTVNLSLDEKSVGLTLLPQKNSNSISADEAISKICDSESNCEAFLNSDKGEIRIRLIDNDGYDYWYVGLLDGEKTVSYLIDGETGEIIAKKDDFKK